MKSIRTPFLHALLAVGLMAATAAGARDNPVDPVSNPHKLAFRDVEARRPDFKEPFLRDGVVTRPAGFRQITAGVPQAQVGQPLRQGDGGRGAEWDYNFKLRLPQSENFLVCQYKVVFDAQTQIVREAVWRRQQCQGLVANG